MIYKVVRVLVYCLLNLEQQKERRNRTNGREGVR
jgi:hypothetical protein